MGTAISAQRISRMSSLRCQVPFDLAPDPERALEWVQKVPDPHVVAHAHMLAVEHVKFS